MKPLGLRLPPPPRPKWPDPESDQRRDRFTSQSLTPRAVTLTLPSLDALPTLLNLTLRPPPPACPVSILVSVFIAILPRPTTITDYELQFHKLLQDRVPQQGTSHRQNTGQDLVGAKGGGNPGVPGGQDLVNLK